MEEYNIIISMKKHKNVGCFASSENDRRCVIWPVAKVELVSNSNYENGQRAIEKEKQYFSSPSSINS